LPLQGDDRLHRRGDLEGEPDERGVDERRVLGVPRRARPVHAEDRRLVLEARLGGESSAGVDPPHPIGARDTLGQASDPGADVHANTSSAALAAASTRSAPSSSSPSPSPSASSAPTAAPSVSSSSMMSSPDDRAA